MGSGIEIYEYHASYLHAKVAVIDGQWATVGSSNIDPYSLLLAREANLAIRDTGFAGELRASLLAAIANDAVRIGDEYGRTRNFFGRLIAHLSTAWCVCWSAFPGIGSVAREDAFKRRKKFPFLEAHVTR